MSFFRKKLLLKQLKGEPNSKFSSVFLTVSVCLCVSFVNYRFFLQIITLGHVKSKSTKIYLVPSTCRKTQSSNSSTRCFLKVLQFMKRLIVHIVEYIMTLLINENPKAS